MTTAIDLILEVHFQDPVDDTDEARTALSNLVLSALARRRLDPQTAVPGTRILGYAVSTALRHTTPTEPRPMARRWRLPLAAKPNEPTFHATPRKALEALYAVAAGNGRYADYDLRSLNVGSRPPRTGLLCRCEAALAPPAL